MLIFFAAVFFTLLLLCLLTGTAMTWALLGGLILFWVYGKLRGFTHKQLWSMARKELKKGLIVVAVVFLIGIITGLWRISGTIAFCIVVGMELIAPELFLVGAFVLSALLSYVLGTSFGVSSTLGVILMAIARSGGVDPVITAGVVLSGVYFGDRCSPASSAASLVAAVTDTKLYSNVKKMLLTGLLPTALTAALYTALSFSFPLETADRSVTVSIENAFSVSWPALLPAVVMFLLPLCRVPIRISMICSALTAAVVAVTVQGFGIGDVISAAWSGYYPQQEEIAAVLSGGGILSMANSMMIVSLTSMYSGILRGVGALDTLSCKTKALAARIGRFPAMAAVSALCAGILCNQAVTVMLGTQLMRGSYEDREELAQDMENSGIMIAGLIPWSVACSVPLAMLGADMRSLPYAALLWLTPLVYGLTKKLFYPGRKTA